MFIQTEETQDSERLRFLPGREVLPEGTLNLKTKEQAASSPLAEQLFTIPGVAGVLLNKDSIVVTRSGSDWQHLKPAILGAIMEHFMSGAPIVRAEGEGEPAPAEADEFFDPADAETVATIKDLIETRVRPAVAGDGGDITFKGYREGIVFLHMKGACSGCPSSTATLKHGIQNLLHHFVPEVVDIQAV